MISLGQREIMDYLKRYPNDWISLDEILRNVDTGKYSIKHSLTKLVRSGEIERRYEWIEDTNNPGRKRVLTWIRITIHHKYALEKEGLL